jgi:hypothetical protein
LSSTIDPLKRDRWARLRFSIIGPLLAAPPAAGELQAALTHARRQALATSPLGPRSVFRQVDAGALVLPARRCRPGRHAQKPAARQHRPFPQHAPTDRRSADRPVPRTSRLDRATALRQPARRRGQRFTAAVLPHRSTLPQGAGHVPPSGVPSAPPTERYWPATASTGWRSEASRSIRCRRSGTSISITPNARC